MFRPFVSRPAPQVVWRRHACFDFNRAGPSPRRMEAEWTGSPHTEVPADFFSWGGVQKSQL
jgi:hypothetical protein